MAPGDEIVVTGLDHDGNVDPWRAIAADRGLTVRTVEIRGSTTAPSTSMTSTAPRPANEARGGRLGVERRRDDQPGRRDRAARPRGRRLDVRRCRPRRAAPADRRAGARDRLPRLLDLQVLRARTPACCTAGPTILDALPTYKLRPAHDRFETGTQNFEALAGVVAAVDYLAGVGVGPRRGAAPVATPRGERVRAAMTAIRAYEMELYRRLVDGLEAIPGLRLYGITDRSRSSTADADRGADDRGLRAAGDQRGARPGRDRHVGRRLLRDGPDRAARPGRDRRRRPDRADPLQHGRGGRPRRRRRSPGSPRATPVGEPAGAAVSPDVADRRRRDRRDGGGRVPGRAGARVTLYERTATRGRRLGPQLGSRPATVRPGARRALPRVARGVSRSRGRAAGGAFGARRGAGRAAATSDGTCPSPGDRRRAGRGVIRTADPEVIAGGTCATRLEPRSPRTWSRAGLAIGYPVAPASATRAYAAVAERAAQRSSSARRASRIRDGAPSASRSTALSEPAGAVIVAAGPWTPRSSTRSVAWQPIRPIWGVVAAGRARGAPAPRPRGERASTSSPDRRRPTRRARRWE